MVSEDEEEMALIERYDVVPVPPDVGPLTAGHIPDGRFHPGDLRQDLGEQGVLENLGDTALFAVHPPVLRRQPLRLTAATDEEVAESGGHQSEDRAQEHHDQGQAGEQRAPQLAVRCGHDGDGTVPEGNGVAGPLSREGKPARGCFQEV